MSIFGTRFRGAGRCGGCRALSRQPDLRVGADAVINPQDPHALQQIKDLCNGIGPDCALDCSGVVAAHRRYIDAVRRKGQVAFAGECGDETPIRISPDMISKGIKLIGSWHYNPNLFPHIMRVIQQSLRVENGSRIGC